MMDLREGCARCPGMIPVQNHVHGTDLANQSGFHRVPHIGEIRRPSPVLIHGHAHATCLRVGDKSLGGGQIHGKGLLAEDVFARVGGTEDQVFPRFRMRRDIHDPDGRVLEDFIGAGTDPRLRKIFGAALLRRLPFRIKKRRHFPSGGTVSLKVM